MKIEFLPEKCTACGACSVACMDLNDIDTEGGQRPYRRVYSLEQADRTVYVSAACRHCADAPCAEVCPVRCLHHDPAARLTVHDGGRCIGCRRCETACPYDAVTFRAVSDAPHPLRMEKCHGCAALTAEGLLPACVRACPTGALLFNKI